MARETIEEVLRIVAEIDPAIRSIEQLKQKIADLKKAASRIDMAADPSAYKKLNYEIDRLEAAEKRLATTTRQANEELRRQNQAVSDTTRASGMANASLLALGYAFSDMGQFGVGFSFGIRAIANNISSLSIALTLLNAEAKAAGMTFKSALLKSLRGPYGLIVAFQIVVGLIDLWASSQRKAKEEAEKLNERLDIQDGKVVGLYNAYKKLNPESEEAIKIKKELSKELKVNIDNYEDLNDAVLDHIKVLELEKDISYVLEERSKVRISQRRIEANSVKLLAENTKTFQDRNEEQLNIVNKLITNSPEILWLKGEEVRLNNLLGDLYTKLIPLLKGDAAAKEESKKILEESKSVWDDYLRFVERGIDLLGDINKERQEASDALLTDEQRSLLELEREYEDHYNNLEQMLTHYGITEDEYRTAKLSLELSFEDRLLAIKQQYADKKLNVEKNYAALRRAERLKDVNATLKAEEDARQKALERIEQTEQAKMQFASNTVGFLISLNAAMAGASEEERRKAFKRDKALRVAQATIDTYAGANRAFATAPGTPLGFFLAAAVVAAGLANVATIMGQNYDGGVMGNSRFARGVDGGMGQGIQGGYPYPMTGGSTLQPQFPDRTGSLDIRPRTQRLYVLEADITDAQQAQVDRGMKAGVF